MVAPSLPTEVLTEFAASGISPELAQVNIRWISGPDAVTEFLEGTIAARQRNHSYLTATNARLVRRYEFIEQSGWIAYGENPDGTPAEVPYLKPTCPRWDEERQRRIKYETPPGLEARPLLPVMEPRWDAIATRWDIDRNPGESCWQAIARQPHVPIIITEGLKKALALVELGFPAIALRGVSQWHPKDCRELWPEIAAVVEGKSQVAIAFDEDEKSRTRQAVGQQAQRLAAAITAIGSTPLHLTWDGKQGKGIDDALVALPHEHRGPWLAERVATAVNPNQYQLEQWLNNRLGRTGDRTCSPKEISPDEVPSAGIVAMAAGQGAGKTEAVAKLLQHNGPSRQLLLGHRIALMRNLSDRLGLAYRADCDVVNGRYASPDGYIERLGACIDSLAHPGFNPQLWEGCDLIIDELVQVLRHLVASGTLKDRRAIIIQRFEALIRGARRVIVADADIDEKSLSYLEWLRGEHCWLLRWQGKPQPWEALRFINAPDRSAIFAEIELAASEGKRLFIASDSIRCCEDLEGRLRPIVGDRNLLTITSKTSGGEAEQAFIRNPGGDHGYQIAIVSPSAITGMSDESDWFDAVYGVFQGGSITDADVIQALMRVRRPVPRTVWAKDRGSAFSRLGDSTSPRILARSLSQQATTTAAIMAANFGLTPDTNTATSPVAQLFCHFEAERNQGMWHFGALIRLRSQLAGHPLQEVELSTCKDLMDQLKADRQRRQDEESIAIANAEPIDQAQADRLKRKEALSPDELRQLQRFILEQFYKVDMTAQRVTDDDNGTWRLQLRRMEQLLFPELALKRDSDAIAAQQQQGEGIVWWDIPHAGLKTKLRQKLGLERWLDCDRTWRGDDPDLIELHKLATGKRASKAIKAALGITLNPAMTPAAVLGMLLGQLGLKTQSRQQRINGERVRVYWLDAETFERNMAVIRRRHESLTGQSVNTSQTPPTSIEMEGAVCDAPAPNPAPSPGQQHWQYLGTRLQATYGGLVLTPHAQNGEYRSFRLPDGSITTWIHVSECAPVAAAA